MYREGTFDNFNPFTIKGATASGMLLVVDQLMISSPDEPSVEYCLVCEWVSHPDDFSSVTFKLRPEARFNDGKPITVEEFKALYDDDAGWQRLEEAPRPGGDA